MGINTLVNLLFNRSIIILLFIITSCNSNSVTTSNGNYINYISLAFDKSYSNDSTEVKNELLTYFNNRLFYQDGIEKIYSCDQVSFYSQNKKNSRLYSVIISPDSNVTMNIFHINKYGEIKPFANPGKFQFRENTFFVKDRNLSPLSLFIADCIIASSIK